MLLQDTTLKPLRPVRRQFVNQVVTQQLVRDIAAHECREGDAAVHHGYVDMPVARTEADNG